MCKLRFFTTFRLARFALIEFLAVSLMHQTRRNALSLMLITAWMLKHLEALLFEQVHF